MGPILLGFTVSYSYLAGGNSGEKWLRYVIAAWTARVLQSSTMSNPRQ